MKICKVGGCDGPVRSMGYCSTHYSKWLKSGKVSPGPTIRRQGVAKGKICSSPGCGKPVRCIGLCSNHYDWYIRKDKCPICGKPKDKASSLCLNCSYEKTLIIPDKKVCPVCGVEKPIDEFGFRKAKNGLTKVRTPCRKCTAEKARISKSKMDKEKLRKIKQKQAERSKILRISDNDTWIRRSLRLASIRMKLDPVLVLNHYDKIGNRCECCGKSPGISEPRIAIDHDHTTGAFRGFLCSACNIFLGHIERNGEVYQLLIQYMNREVPS